MKLVLNSWMPPSRPNGLHEVLKVVPGLLDDLLMGVDLPLKLQRFGSKALDVLGVTRGFRVGGI
jgi:hypothetical protein